MAQNNSSIKSFEESAVEENSLTIEQIQQQIQEIKEELKDVHGTETEVYARIVGYYRAVKHWNKGKKDEYYQRKMFTLEESHIDNNDASQPICEKEETYEPSVSQNDISSTSSITTENYTYEMYTRKTCPNCPPVKEYMANCHISGRSIDVDTPEGLSEAAKKGVFAAPTVIFFNNQGEEISRCHNVDELDSVFQTINNSVENKLEYTV